MSEHITHLAICDDVTRLAPHTPGIAETLWRTLLDQQEDAHLGAITRSADKWSVEVIRWAREELAKPEGERHRHTRGKLAFALAALTHRGADRLMKPIIRCWDETEGKAGKREATIHMDILSFREVYRGGDWPFTPELLALSVDERSQRLEDCFRLLLRRSLIELHTFAPDPDDIHRWLDGLFDKVQDYPIDLRQYARIAAEWAPAKVKKYLIDKRFYERQDPLIALTREIQRGVAGKSPDVAAAFAASTDSCSRYERALKKALEYLQAASAWYKEEIDANETARRFEVGVPEMSLMD